MVKNDKIVFGFKIVGFLIVFFFIVLSCNKMTPAGFWKKYQSDFKIKDISDQGPWGGYRIIHWEANNNDRFVNKDILKYAKDNGWDLIDSIDYGKNLPRSWTFSDKQIFPYNYNESNDLDNQINDKLQRWIESDFKLYSFKTGWIIIKPGTEESTERTGFIILSNDNQKMTVYHLWGE